MSIGNGLESSMYDDVQPKYAQWSKGSVCLRESLIQNCSAADAGGRTKYQQKNDSVIIASYLYYLHVVILKGENRRLCDNCALQYLKFFLEWMHCRLNSVVIQQTADSYTVSVFSSTDQSKFQKISRLGCVVCPAFACGNCNCCFLSLLPSLQPPTG